MRKETRIAAILILAALLLAPAGYLLAQEEQERQEPEIVERIFTIQHGDVQAIYRMIRSFVTAWGTINADENSSIIVVRDTSEAVAHMAAIIAEMDLAPENIGLTFFAFRATKGGSRTIPEGLPEGVKRGLNELAGVMAYRVFSPIDSGMLTLASSADRGELRLTGIGGADLEISFKINYSRQSKHLQLYRLLVRLEKGDDGMSLMQTDIGVENGGVAVVGASKLDGGDEALVVIVTMNVIQN